MSFLCNFVLPVWGFPVHLIDCSFLAAKVTGSTTTPEDDYVEGFVCGEADIGENEMKSFELDGGKVLLIKQKGQLSAIGNKCSHYGALLSTGALGDGRVRCPWHGACFNVLTGDIEDFPGQDSLPCFNVTVESGKVIGVVYLLLNRTS